MKSKKNKLEQIKRSKLEKVATKMLKHEEKIGGLMKYLKNKSK